MSKLIKNLRIIIDLQSIVSKPITENTENLLNHSSWKGSLGMITLLAEVFDLYLLVPKSKIKEEELLRWLKAANITFFRKFFTTDEDIRDIILTSSINVTITSTKELAESLKDVTKVYFLQKKKSNNIQGGIQIITQWKEIIKYLTFFSNE